MYKSKVSVRMALITSLYIHHKNMDKVIKEARKAEAYILEGIEVQDTDLTFNDILSKMSASHFNKYKEERTTE